jgi:MoaA/NifB/PqqE/SkfB family radical SAM enzyme
MNDYLAIDNVKSIQIDHTSRCNCMCPQCARVSEGIVNPRMPIDELTVEDYKVIFPSTIIKQVELITQCGNYGDIVASNTILDCLEWLRENGSTAHINIMTNGSARNMDWWKRLASIIGLNGRVTFSIDGLEDTNHLYRVGAIWNKVIENANTYIENGGRARWDYLIFDHNQHQVEEAEKLAREIGFESFYVKNTSRFINDKNYLTGKVSEEETLKQPTDEKYRSTSSEKFVNIIDKHNTWENYINETTIDCKFQKQSALFVDFQARLWPCTWVAAPIHFAKIDNIQTKQIHSLMEHYGTTFNSLRHHTLEDVLTHEWFASNLVSSWETDEKLMTCGRTCGTDYEFSSRAPANSKLTKFKILTKKHGWIKEGEEHFNEYEAMQ